jgi:DNA-binding MarR family transcriptional regulator
MEKLDHLLALIFEAGKRTKEYLRSSKDTSLSLGQLQTLRHIEEHQDCSMKEVAQFLCIAPPSATALIESLVTKKYLVRTADTKDRRAVHIHITPSGKKEMKKTADIIEKRMKKILGVLTEQEITSFITILEKLYETK